MISSATGPRHPRSAATRRQFLGTSAAVALLLAACGREADPAAGTNVTVEGAFGPVQVPARPQRVVTGYFSDTDFALLAGLPLAGAPGARSEGSSPFPAYQAQRLDGVTLLSSTYPTINVEEIAALAPDLILDSVPDDEARHRALSGIAPTWNFSHLWVPADRSPQDWKGSLRAIGTAFGAGAVVEDEIARYEQRATELRERLNRERPGLRVTDVSLDNGVVYVNTRRFQGPIVLGTDLGLTLDDTVRPADQDSLELGAETVGQLADADVIFVALNVPDGATEPDRTDIRALEANPLWRELPAVRAGRVVEYNTQLTVCSPNTAAMFVDVVERGLLGG